MGELAMRGTSRDLGSGSESRIDVDKPLWNQDTYFGRWMHYAFITDCRTILVPENKLREAKKLCEDYKAGREPEDLRREDIIYAKKLRDSAFHPDNGELMNVIGRMSFQLPGCVAITAAMLTFYKLTFYTNNNRSTRTITRSIGSRSIPFLSWTISPLDQPSP